MKELKEVKSRYEFSLDTRQAVLIVSGFILVLMLSFLMGTLFGRNLSGQGNAALASVAPAEAPAEEVVRDDFAEEERDLAWLDEDGGAPSDKIDSRERFIEELESMKVPKEVDKTPAEPFATPPAMARLDDPEPAARPTPEDDFDREADRPAKKSPEPAESEEKSEKHVVRAGTYTIQLASLPNRGDAVALLDELRNKRYDAYMLQVNLPDKGTFYRVRVGHYRDLDQAKKALKILQARESKFFDAWITQ